MIELRSVTNLTGKERKLCKGEIVICYREFMRNFVMEVVEMISSISQKFILDELENQL